MARRGHAASQVAYGCEDSQPDGHTLHISTAQHCIMLFGSAQLRFVSVIGNKDFGGLIDIKVGDHTVLVDQNAVLSPRQAKPRFQLRQVPICFSIGISRSRSE